MWPWCPFRRSPALCITAGDAVVAELLRPIAADPLATLAMKKSGKVTLLTITKSTPQGKLKGKSARERAQSKLNLELAAITQAYGSENPPPSPPTWVLLTD